MHPDAGDGQVGRRNGTSAAWDRRWNPGSETALQQGVAGEWFGVVVGVCNDEPGGGIDV